MGESAAAFVLPPQGLGASPLGFLRLPRLPSRFLRPTDPDCNPPKMGRILPDMGNIEAVRRFPRRRRTLGEGADGRTGVADALFTTTQQRVLSLLFGRPSRSFFASELIELTGSGSGAVHRELKRLVSSGLVTVTRLGRQKHHSANPDSPVFAELRGLVLKTVGLAEPIRDALAPLVDRISLALVFGSVAKGTATADSDIDLLVVGDDLTLETLYAALLPAETVLARQISPTLYTTGEFAERRAAGNAFLRRVLAGDHLLLAGALEDQ